MVSKTSAIPLTISSSFKRSNFYKQPYMFRPSLRILILGLIEVVRLDSYVCNCTMSINSYLVISQAFKCTMCKVTKLRLFPPINKYV